MQVEVVVEVETQVLLTGLTVLAESEEEARVLMALTPQAVSQVALVQQTPVEVEVEVAQQVALVELVVQEWLL